MRLQILALTLLITQCKWVSVDSQAVNPMGNVAQTLNDLLSNPMSAGNNVVSQFMTQGMKSFTDTGSKLFGNFMNPMLVQKSKTTEVVVQKQDTTKLPDLPTHQAPIASRASFERSNADIVAIAAAAATAALQQQQQQQQQIQKAHHRHKQRKAVSQAPPASQPINIKIVNSAPRPSPTPIQVKTQVTSQQAGAESSAATATVSQSAAPSVASRSAVGPAPGSNPASAVGSSNAAATTATSTVTSSVVASQPAPVAPAAPVASAVVTAPAASSASAVVSAPASPAAPSASAVVTAQAAPAAPAAPVASAVVSVQAAPAAPAAPVTATASIAPARPQAASASSVVSVAASSKTAPTKVAVEATSQAAGVKSAQPSVIDDQDQYETIEEIIDDGGSARRRRKRHANEVDVAAGDYLPKADCPCARATKQLASKPVESDDIDHPSDVTHALSHIIQSKLGTELSPQLPVQSTAASSSSHPDHADDSPDGQPMLQSTMANLMPTLPNSLPTGFMQPAPMQTTPVDAPVSMADPQPLDQAGPKIAAPLSRSAADNTMPSVQTNLDTSQPLIGDALPLAAPSQDLAPSTIDRVQNLGQNFQQSGPTEGPIYGQFLTLGPNAPLKGLSQTLDRAIQKPISPETNTEVDTTTQTVSVKEKSAITPPIEGVQAPANFQTQNLPLQAMNLMKPIVSGPLKLPMLEQAELKQAPWMADRTSPATMLAPDTPIMSKLTLDSPIANLGSVPAPGADVQSIQNQEQAQTLAGAPGMTVSQIFKPLDQLNQFNQMPARLLDQPAGLIKSALQIPGQLMNLISSPLRGALSVAGAPVGGQTGKGLSLNEIGSGVIPPFQVPIPQQDGSMVQQSGPILQQDGSILQQGGPMMLQGGPMMQQGGPMMLQGGPMIQQSGPILQQGRPILQQDGSILQQGGLMIQQSGPILQEGGPMIQQGGPILQQGEPVIQLSAPMIQQGGPILQQVGPMIQQGGPMMQQGGLMMQQGGPMAQPAPMMLQSEGPMLLPGQTIPQMNQYMPYPVPPDNQVPPMPLAIGQGSAPLAMPLVVGQPNILPIADDLGTVSSSAFKENTSNLPREPQALANALMANPMQFGPLLPNRPPAKVTVSVSPGANFPPGVTKPLISTSTTLTSDGLANPYNINESLNAVTRSKTTVCFTYDN